MFKRLKSGNAFDNGLMFAYILAFIVLLASCQANTYTRQEVEELKQEYESQIESAREDGYNDGYSSGYDDGFGDALGAAESNPEDSPTARDSHVVWVTPAGSKYHLRSCSAIRGHTVERTTIEKAEKAGYTACSKCSP